MADGGEAAAVLVDREDGKSVVVAVRAVDEAAIGGNVNVGGTESGLVVDVVREG